jgi:alcohol dehydrogenase
MFASADSFDLPASWQSHSPVRLVAGRLEQLPTNIDCHCEVLIVSSAGASRRGFTSRAMTSLRSGVTLLDNVPTAPDLKYLSNACAALSNSSARMIIAIGGGSVIDAAKVFSLGIRAKHFDLQAALQRPPQELPDSAIPLIAVPTTAGSGAEMTPFATVWDFENASKFSLSSPLLSPKAAFFDAGLTLSLVGDDALFPALDAISHALESLWNVNQTERTAALAWCALQHAVRALPRIRVNESDLDARREMQFASALAGMAIAQTRTAVAHGISYPLTARFGVPHGLACSFTLPAILAVNFDSLNRQSPLPGLIPQVSEMLSSLGLGARLSRLVSTKDAIALAPEMYAPGRSENYRGASFGDIAELVELAMRDRVPVV